MESYKFYLFLLFSVIFLLAYKLNDRIQYSIKFFYYTSIWGLFAIVFLPVFMLRPRNPSNFVIPGVFTPLLAYLYKLKYIIRGKEHMETKGSHIVIANHQSCLDGMGMNLIWKYLDKCTVIVKKELVYFLPFFIAGWLNGMVFIDRSNVKVTKIKMKEAGQKLKKKGIKIIIFPEGTRFHTGRIESFKKGAFHVAIDCQLPIIPVVISNYYFIGIKTYFFRSGNVIISALPPIPTKGLTAENINELIEKTHRLMSEEFDRISKEAASL